MNIIIGVAILLLVNSAFATDYCRKDLCPDVKKTHICCKHDGAWNTTNCGRNPHLHKLTEADQQFILDLHNKHRDQIASGSVERYSSAINMKEVTWNNELAAIACYNAKNCSMIHDACRSTDKHKYAGQNLAIIKSTGGFLPFRETYEYLHTKWFMEHKHCDMSNIRSYQGKPITKGEAIGHFTQLVSDQTDEIGCCVSMFDKDGYRQTYIVCNYSRTNIRDKPIYVEGKPKCTTFSKKYKSLCAK